MQIVLGSCTWHGSRVSLYFDHVLGFRDECFVQGRPILDMFSVTGCHVRVVVKGAWRPSRFAPCGSVVCVEVFSANVTLAV